MIRGRQVSPKAASRLDGGRSSTFSNLPRCIGLSAISLSSWALGLHGDDEIGLASQVYSELVGRLDPVTTLDRPGRHLHYQVSLMGDAPVYTTECIAMEHICATTPAWRPVIVFSPSEPMLISLSRTWPRSRSGRRRTAARTVVGSVLLVHPKNN